MTTLFSGPSIRRDAGLYGYERALRRRGINPVAGVDEAGRGACAGPLVAAAVILDGPIRGLADSKLLTAQQREKCYDEIMTRAVSVGIVSITPAQCDAWGMHRANLTALRRAVARLEVPPGFVLSDGFAVDGLATPGLAVWKGDRVSGAIAAASVVAKVTRDRVMTSLSGQFPRYEFARHKGYATAVHQAALERWGPTEHHRMSYANVVAAQKSRQQEVL